MKALLVIVLLLSSNLLAAPSNPSQDIVIVGAILEMAPNPHALGIPEPSQPLLIEVKEILRGTLKERKLAVDVPLNKGRPGTVVWKTGPIVLNTDFFQPGAEYLLYLRRSSSYRWKFANQEFPVRWAVSREFRLKRALKQQAL